MWSWLHKLMSFIRGDESEQQEQGHTEQYVRPSTGVSGGKVQARTRSIYPREREIEETDEPFRRRKQRQFKFPVIPDEKQTEKRTEQAPPTENPADAVAKRRAERARATAGKGEPERRRATTSDSNEQTRQAEEAVDTVSRTAQPLETKRPYKPSEVISPVFGKVTAETEDADHRIHTTAGVHSSRELINEQQARMRELTASSHAERAEADDRSEASSDLVLEMNSEPVVQLPENEKTETVVSEAADIRVEDGMQEEESFAHSVHNRAQAPHFLDVDNAGGQPADPAASGHMQPASTGQPGEEYSVTVGEMLEAAAALDEAEFDSGEAEDNGVRAAVDSDAEGFAEKLTAEEPVAEEPVGKLTVQEPVAEEPVGKLTVEEPVAEEPAEKQTSEEPAAEGSIEPAAVEPASKQSGEEQPIVSVSNAGMPFIGKETNAEQKEAEQPVEEQTAQEMSASPRATIQPGLEGSRSQEKREEIGSAKDESVNSSSQSVPPHSFANPANNLQGVAPIASAAEVAASLAAYAAEKSEPSSAPQKETNEANPQQRQAADVTPQQGQVAVVNPLQRQAEVVNQQPAPQPDEQPLLPYASPSLELLAPSPEQDDDDDEHTQIQKLLLEETLSNFNVNAQVVGIVKGPSVTRFEIQPAPGVKVNKITSLIDDIKLNLAAKDIRIEAPIPGRNAVGIEVPNLKSQPVLISRIIGSEKFLQHSSPLAVALGMDIGGEPIVADIKKMPHGLIAGSTGSGKSVCINSIIVSLLYKATPEQVRLLLIDPKMVELAPYNHLPHLVTPVVTDAKQATAALKWAVEEMEKRYALFVDAGVRDIDRYNQTTDQPLPYIVIVIDELADLMMVSPQDVEDCIIRIAQKARACGIHLLLATQRPSVDVITGNIKANVPTRLAFAVFSQVDSRTILDQSGAERLLGRGDMLFLESGTTPIRLQGNYVTDEEIEAVTQAIKRQRKPAYLFSKEDLEQQVQSFDMGDDPLYHEALLYVADQGQASASALQRRFRVGYNRAARLIEMMEADGYVAGQSGGKPRAVLITREDAEALTEGTSLF
ncbi:DNA translocase FtsK [Brevibacillus borstelensis]|uniref:DNA translocase FtsK n=1 Tax=Brevibacillus borstelensis TaxID=45462 RepID=UPI00287F8D91|nr:DNA translocase FtsK [Brevibacillus borstelensis]WNF07139.1 DNA translocase FtsK [Brevibacillus borstelensis]